jgi:acyl-CoA thioesterase-1
VTVAVGVALCAACGGSTKDAARDSAAGERVSADSARAGAAGAATSERTPQPTVLFVGTSLTAGLGLEPDSAYPQRLQRRADSLGLGWRFVNAGLSGETSAGALRRIDWLLRGDADVVVLETGANDGLRGLDVDSTKRNIEAIVAKVRAVKPKATIVLVQMEAPPNLGASYTSRFHAMYEDVAQKNGLVLMPFLLGQVAGVGRLNQADGVHPNDAGERIVAETVWRTLRPVLDSLDRSRKIG